MRMPFYLSVHEDILEPPFLMGNVFVREENYFLAEHSHPFYHVNFVTEGEAVLHVLGQTLRVSAPGYMILPPFVPHAIESKSGYSQVGMNIGTGEDDRVSLLDAFCGGESKVGDGAAFGVSFSRFLGLLSGAMDSLSVWRIRSSYDALLLSLLESGERPTQLARRLAALSNEKDLVKMSLTELCEALHFSKTHLERLFRKEMGVSAAAYLSRLRIARAAALLSDSDLSLSDIAEECGFFDASHFCKGFKRATGFSPGRYRKRNT